MTPPDTSKTPTRADYRMSPYARCTNCGEYVGDGCRCIEDAIVECRLSIDTLFARIAHGDDEHRAWLKSELDRHFAHSVRLTDQVLDRTPTKKSEG